MNVAKKPALTVNEEKQLYPEITYRQYEWYNRACWSLILRVQCMTNISQRIQIYQLTGEDRHTPTIANNQEWTITTSAIKNFHLRTTQNENEEWCYLICSSRAGTCPIRKIGGVLLTSHTYRSNTAISWEETKWSGTWNLFRNVNWNLFWKRKLDCYLKRETIFQIFAVIWTSILKQRNGADNFTALKKECITRYRESIK